MKGVLITPPRPPQRSATPTDWKSAQAAVRVVSNKWVIPIIAALADRPLRHSEIHRAIGPAISPKVLTETLHLMQHNGLIAEREPHTAATTAPYALTTSAVELLEPLTALARWHARTNSNKLRAEST